MAVTLPRAAAALRAWLATCLVAPVAVLGACGSDAPTPPISQPAVAESVAVLSIDTPQVVGASVEVRVRAMTSSGGPVADDTVEWVVINGTGSVAPSTSITNADGIATSMWTFGPHVVHYRLAARVGDLTPVEFASTPRAASAE